LPPNGRGRKKRETNWCGKARTADAKLRNRGVKSLEGNGRRRGLGRIIVLFKSGSQTLFGFFK